MTAPAFDSMNTTARVETTGRKNQIHLSETTAALISNANKGHWIVKREDKVTAKGKGEMTTYWLLPPVAAMVTDPSGPSLQSTSSFETTSACKAFGSFITIAAIASHPFSSVIVTV